MSSSTDIRIRPARLHDAPALAKLVRREAECAQQTATYYVLDSSFDWITFTNYKLADARRAIFLAEFGQELAGYVDVQRVAHPKPSRSKHRFLSVRRRRRLASPVQPITWGIIDGCYVTSAYRRSGIGTRLVAEAMRWFDTQDLKRVELAVLAGNEAGRRFWQKCGFEPFRLGLAKSSTATRVGG